MAKESPGYEADQDPSDHKASNSAEHSHKYPLDTKLIRSPQTTSSATQQSTRQSGARKTRSPQARSSATLFGTGQRNHLDCRLRRSPQKMSYPTQQSTRQLGSLNSMIFMSSLTKIPPTISGSRQMYYLDSRPSWNLKTSRPITLLCTRESSHLEPGAKRGFLLMQ